MFNWELTSKLFDSFTILRWTDYIKPIEYVEIEKHAIKSILTYIIGKEYEERTGDTLDWEYIVQNNILGLLSKIATSDIKAPVHAKIKKENPDSLNDFIIGTYFDDKQAKFFPKGSISKTSFYQHLTCVINSKSGKEDKISYFAHKFATYREFCSIKLLNGSSPDLEKDDSDILNTLNDVETEKNSELNNVFEEIQDTDSELFKFYSYFEKLRPQIRWSQTCRLPQTTVLGHSMYVAVLTYFAIKELLIDVEGDRNKILVNSFYAALFHDLPESLTRDIISPVKRSIEGLEGGLLAQYEYSEVETNMATRLNDRGWVNDFMFLLGKTKNTAGQWVFEPFVDRTDKNIKNDNKKEVLGVLIQYMDKIAAFVEAKMSVDFGINSIELQNGIKYSIDYLFNKSYQNDHIKNTNGSIAKSLNMNDFFASIPHYTIGPSK